MRPSVSSHRSGRRAVRDRGGSAASWCWIQIITRVLTVALVATGLSLTSGTAGPAPGTAPSSARVVRLADGDILVTQTQTGIDPAGVASTVDRLPKKPAGGVDVTLAVNQAVTTFNSAGVSATKVDTLSGAPGAVFSSSATGSGSTGSVTLSVLIPNADIQSNKLPNGVARVITGAAALLGASWRGRCAPS